MTDRNDQSAKKLKPYTRAAGGWGALASTGKHLLKSENAVKNIRTLLKTNQDNGFDCPGCAWGEDGEDKKFRFCENGAKAVNWEATSRKVGPDFFSRHSVSWLREQSDYFLEYQGRLTHPMRYNQESDRYEDVSWQEAFNLIADTLNGLEHPDQAEFYTSGRASNEAAFLYQLFVRSFGTNNFPDCSNMCHEASGVALSKSIGVGKGTVSIHDFEKADAIFIFGQNPGTNHPRMLDVLYKASRRGAKIVSFNPLKERGLERFTNPQNAVEMITDGSTEISGMYLTPKMGGDMAAVRGMVKAMLAEDKLARQEGRKPIFNDEFLSTHTQGLELYLEQVENTSWDFIEEQSGLCRTQLEEAAAIYQKSEKAICTWAMGITQHRHSVDTIFEITNLLLLRGNMGKPGAGACPVRGHSNVQGDRTMGINEKPDEAFLEKMDQVFDMACPREHGHNTVQSIRAMLEGKSKVFIGLGGNFAAATPDTQLTEKALAQCQLTVNIATKLNRSHLITGKESLILPCLGRTEMDLQTAGSQSITVEDSFSMVHASGGVLEPASDLLKSEPEIVAGMAQATLGSHPVEWLELVKDYGRIRDLIEKVIPGFTGFNEQIKQPGGFYLGNSARDLNWNTSEGKAVIFAKPLPESIIPASVTELTDKPIFVLQTLRSHDQYNTTIYGMDDRYRGVYGQRRVLMMCAEDIRDLGMVHQDRICIRSLWPDQVERQVDDFTLVEYDIPRGNVAAYYPETNPLVPLESVGEFSDTPTSKSIPVVIEKYQDEETIAVGS
ncbi:FdhF/YdeP family oxidoreductase [Endozoicomonas arenosclerae]|uniref:FdhF/YdeP family oxidoreductase n=1 Tax=Endozoicomonas arenosclerae TaxID=1633495 RepID=UPI000785107D|nr:FdhF/YdeP family oxidoreductase [Endozoicomonas arenosclerae]